MRKVLVVGIGTGNPDHLTIEAVRALNRAQVFFIPDKGSEKQALRRLREQILDRFVEQPGYRSVIFDVPRRQSGTDGYRHDVETWHAEIADRYAALLRDELGEDCVGAFLVWGDPSLYDSTLRILDAVAARGAVAFETEVIPGITSVQVLAARHRMALNRIGEPVHITTGRRLADRGPDPSGSTVVMLDGGQALAGIADHGLDIVWGAYLGMAEEVLVAGPLSEVRAEIERRRAEARSRNGWIMDTYLLRRREG